MRDIIVSIESPYGFAQVHYTPDGVVKNCYIWRQSDPFKEDGEDVGAFHRGRGRAHHAGLVIANMLVQLAKGITPVKVAEIPSGGMLPTEWYWAEVKEKEWHKFDELDPTQ